MRILEREREGRKSKRERSFGDLGSFLCDTLGEGGAFSFFNFFLSMLF